MGLELLDDEPPDRLAELLVFVCEYEVLTGGLEVRPEHVGCGGGHEADGIGGARESKQ
jgi:hypothetical protein